ncbi:MAG TPA: NCS2 family permease [Methanothrix sp.]|nr:NCS2 family permease [Methanothrix sp.]
MGQEMMTRISRWFDLYNNGTDIRTEVLAGVTAFLATMYIILVNPAVLSEAGLPFNAVLTATVLVSAFSSILMGLYAKNPIVVAPGMSINYLFAYTVVKVEGVPWETALGCVFWAGAIFFLLTVLDRKKLILEGVPPMLRYGFAGGIGLFIASLGFQSAGFVVPLESGVLGWSKISASTLTFLAGFIFTAVLMVRRVRGGLIFGIAATALLAWGMEIYLGMETPSLSGGWWAAPDFSLLLQLDLLGSLRLSLWPVIFVFLLSCLFDSLATVVGVCEAGNLIDEEGDPRNLGKSLKVNALDVMASAALGTSPSTCFVESAAGVQEGGRTGLAAVVAGLLFLPFLFLSPLLSLVPALATAPVLVLVGVFMLKPLIYVRWERFDDAIPFFMAMFLMPLTYSITQGIIWGCLSWTVLKAACGKRGQVSLVMWAMALLSLLLLIDLERFVH